MNGSLTPAVPLIKRKQRFVEPWLSKSVGEHFSIDVAGRSKEPPAYAF
jgi:hypothetical protein